MEEGRKFKISKRKRDRLRLSALYGCGAKGVSSLMGRQKELTNDQIFQFTIDDRMSSFEKLMNSIHREINPMDHDISNPALPLYQLQLLLSDTLQQKFSLKELAAIISEFKTVPFSSKQGSKTQIDLHSFFVSLKLLRNEIRNHNHDKLLRMKQDFDDKMALTHHHTESFEGLEAIDFSKESFSSNYISGIHKLTESINFLRNTEETKLQLIFRSTIATGGLDAFSFQGYCFQQFGTKLTVPESLAIIQFLNTYVNSSVDQDIDNEMNSNHLDISSRRNIHNNTYRHHNKSNDYYEISLPYFLSQLRMLSLDRRCVFSRFPPSDMTYTLPLPLAQHQSSQDLASEKTVIGMKCDEDDGRYQATKSSSMESLSSLNKAMDKSELHPSRLASSSSNNTITSHNYRKTSLSRHKTSGVRLPSLPNQQQPLLSSESGMNTALKAISTLYSHIHNHQVMQNRKKSRGFLRKDSAFRSRKLSDLGTTDHTTGHNGDSHKITAADGAGAVVNLLSVRHNQYQHHHEKPREQVNDPSNQITIPTESVSSSSSSSSIIHNFLSGVQKKQSHQHQHRHVRISDELEVFADKPLPEEGKGGGGQKGEKSEKLEGLHDDLDTSSPDTRPTINPYEVASNIKTMSKLDKEGSNASVDGSNNGKKRSSKSTEYIVQELYDEKGVPMFQSYGVYGTSSGSSQILRSKTPVPLKIYIPPEAATSSSNASSNPFPSTQSVAAQQQSSEKSNKFDSPVINKTVTTGPSPSGQFLLEQGKGKAVAIGGHDATPPKLLLQIQRRHLHYGFVPTPLNPEARYARYEARWKAIVMLNRELRKQGLETRDLLQLLRVASVVTEEEEQPDHADIHSQKHTHENDSTEDLWIKTSILREVLNTHFPEIPPSSIKNLCDTMDPNQESIFPTFELVSLLACFSKIMNKRDGLDIVETIMRAVCNHLQLKRLPRGIIEAIFCGICTSSEVELEMMSLFESLFNKSATIRDSSVLNHVKNGPPSAAKIISVLGATRSMTTEEVVDFVAHVRRLNILVESEYKKVCFLIIHGDKFKK